MKNHRLCRWVSFFVARKKALFPGGKARIHAGDGSGHSCFHAVQIVGPRLHHAALFQQVFGMVVGARTAFFSQWANWRSIQSRLNPCSFVIRLRDGGKMPRLPGGKRFCKATRGVCGDSGKVGIARHLPADLRHAAGCFHCGGEWGQHACP